MNNKETNLKEKFYIENPFNEHEKGFYELKPILDLSIIIPVYNTEKYLDECAHSVLNQKTTFSYEIIFVNDGSTDNSLNKLNILENENKDKVRILNKENGGLSSARNYGLKYSKGKYVTFVDSDDYVSYDYVEILMKNAINENADIVKCGYIEFDGVTGNEIRKIKYKRKIINYNSKRIMKVKGHGCMCVMKRELFNEIRFPIGYLYEDMIMRFLVYSSCNKIILIDNLLYYYRINNNSLSRSLSNKTNYKCLSQYFLLKEIIKKHNDMNLIKNDNYYRCILNELSTTMYLRVRHLDKDVIKDIFELCCDIYKQNFKCSNYSYNLNEHFVSFSLKYRRFVLWKVISIYNLILIKYFTF